MAKEKKTINAPSAFIDYEGDSPEAEQWNSLHFERFWGEVLVRKRRVAAHAFSLKHKQLAKRLIHEFELEDLKSMVHWWVEHVELENVVSLEYFYTKRYDIYERSKPKDYDEWEI